MSIEKIKESLINVINQDEVLNYVSLLNDKRFIPFKYQENFSECFHIQIPELENVIIQVEDTWEINEEGDPESFIEGYVMSIPFNFDLLIQKYKEKHNNYDDDHVTELLDSFLDYVYSDHIDFDFVSQTVGYDQVFSYIIKIEDIDKDNFIESIYNIIKGINIVYNKMLLKVLNDIPFFKL